MTNWLLISIISFSFSFCTKAQPLSMNFSQAWVWEYKNEMIPAGEPGYQGELVVYFNPTTNYWLFTPEAYGTSGEMYNWIIGKPDGSYLLSAMGEFEQTTRIRKKLAFPLVKSLPKYYKPTGRKKIFNKNDLGFSKIEGAEFNMKYLKTVESSNVFVGDYPVNFLPIYYFNRLKLEAKLPALFPVNLPRNKLLLEESSVINGKKIYVTFKEISHTNYFIDLRMN
ncbi:hypothetical protein [Pedobacter insulae]|uniref:Uncharacterized protein n=1 Tax=Pedobacter insulae TaxID=414048 RepID=A0A1I2XHE3_9SPHI|nr:hypothetical protein [Pedobacter insulae]SFH12467.1 hypothetical protein SAMN04489864_105223 [Pedobacter insulae]